MSDIHGNGYGSAHDWRAGFTPPSKCTPYRCLRCGVVFGHFYDVTPNIFDAMKKAGMPETCYEEAR